MKNTTKVIIAFLIFNSSFLILNAQVGINDNNASPDASAMLDVKSTTKGMLIPKMTTTQRNNISSPATGLMVYNTTTNTFNYYNGTAWTVVGQDNLGDHTATANIQLNGKYLSNDGNNKGILMDNFGGVFLNTSTNRSFFTKNNNYSNYIEVSNGFHTRAVFGADGAGFTGGPVTDVIVGNWSNGASRLYSNATERIHISKHGLVSIKDTLKITDGSQGAGKVLVSDANGAATWQTLNLPEATPDTAQPVPIEYHGYYIYVHPTDNGTAIDWATAKTTCENLTAFGKSDWYLPSRLELDAMYKQSYRIAGLSQTEIVKYWSSTVKDATYAFTQRLDYGGPDPDAKTDTTGHNCRCVRKN